MIPGVFKFRGLPVYRLRPTRVKAEVYEESSRGPNFHSGHNGTVIAALQSGPKSLAQLLEATGTTNSCLRGVLCRLESHGKIKRVGVARYQRYAIANRFTFEIVA